MRPAPPLARLASQSLVLWAALGAASCATRVELARKLEEATQQQHLPQVVACWERAFEAAGFRGSYVVEVDFTVEMGSGQIRHAQVRHVEPANGSTGGGDAGASERLGRCVAKALEHTHLSKGGFAPSTNVSVVGFRFLFADASSEARLAAADQVPNVLIGPRADRCIGLYTHDPPRDAGLLFVEVTDAERQVSATEPGTDARARALQQAYDLALELEARLRSDLDREELSAESRGKIREQIRRARSITFRIGRAIGCRPPRADGLTGRRGTVGSAR